MKSLKDLWREQQVRMKLKAEGIDPLIDSYSEANYSSGHTLNEVHPGATYKSAEGQSFKPTARYKLTSAKFYLSKNGAPVGNLVAQLYAHSGTYGSSGVPTGNSLAESDPVAMASLTGTRTLYEFTFPAGQRFVLQRGTPYFLECVVKDATVIDPPAGTNFPSVAGDYTSPTHGGNRSYYQTTWIGVSAVDMIFYVYGDLLTGLFKGLFAGAIGKK